MARLPIDIAKIQLTEFIPTEFSVRGAVPTQRLAENGITARFRLNQDIDFTTDLAQRRVGVLLKFEVETVTGDPAEPMGSGGTFVLAFGFFIDNLPEVLAAAGPEDGGGLYPPLQLLVLLTSIAYSTARGILWTRLAGTALEGLSLPIVDINQLLLEVISAKEVASPKGTQA